MAIRLLDLPREIIQLIAFFIAASTPFQPPSDLIKFILINKEIYENFKPGKAATLYSDLFKASFDHEAIKRRFFTRDRTLEPDQYRYQYHCHHCHHNHHNINNDDDDDDDEEEDSYDQNSQHPLQNRRIFDQRIGKTIPERSPSSKLPEIYTEDHHYPNEAQSLSFSWPSSSSSVTKAAEDYVEDRLNKQLSRAYVERWALLHRIRAGYRKCPNLLRDLWLVYLMYMENDGKNLIQLQGFGNLARFLEEYFESELNPDKFPDGYPPSSPENGIVLKLYHPFVELRHPASILHRMVCGDSTDKFKRIESILKILKPYNFAAHLYDVAYAHWTARDLPIPLQVYELNPGQIRNPEMIPFQASQPPPPKLPSLNPRTFYPILRDNDQNSEYWFPSASPSTSRSYQSSHPPAYCEFMYLGKLLRILPPLHAQAAAPSLFWLLALSNETLPGYSRAEVIGRQHRAHQILSQEEFEERINEDGFTSLMRRCIEIDSLEYDREFKRLTRCIDPYNSIGLEFDTYHDCFTGIWDGQFSYLQYGSYEDMMEGNQFPNEGIYGDLTQMFKTRGYIIRLRDGVPVNFIKSTRENPLYHWLYGGGSISENGTCVGPSSSTDQEGTDLRGDENFKGEFQRGEIAQLRKIKLLGLDKEVEDTDYDPREAYELQVHGVGHGAWGKYNLKGRVRPWDGLLSLLKVYTDVHHGTWLYRGYYHPGGTILGRWRDVVTEEMKPGYEGTFISVRR